MTTMPRKDRIYAAVASYWLANGYAPTIREIVVLADISSTSVVYYNLVKLESEGKLTWTRGQGRTVRLTRQEVS